MSKSMFYITVGDVEEAEKLAKVLVEEKLAACVNIIPTIRSCFYWEGKAQVESETLLVGKTRSELIDEILETVKASHSYELPCVVTWDIDDGNPEFLDWITEETKNPGKR